ncbi:DUF4430 domain-containing protein [Xylanibacillus composti]|uniref:Transcobalamin-like C-terminal domain-containing protein n=1 Tax=Xylanibacillus composti TaxID=1572762 RepID=A0A8J4H7U7_9BACL|nr:DUF4430 domain-containing protein [Xylanibacillus composti]GIQ70584.1 hypothetical protein XYCOK13_34080 [Xylanibacillus composti]
MKYKKILYGCILLSVLTISFFLSGTDDVVPLESENSVLESGVAPQDETAGHQEQPLDLSPRGSEPEQEVEEIEGAKQGDSTSSEQIAPEDAAVHEAGRQADEVHASEPVQSTAAMAEKDDQQGEREKADPADQDTHGGKDKYLTDPVPEGRPKPVEWQEAEINEEKTLTATLSVTCKTILNNLHLFNEDKLEVLPEDGVIYEARTVTFYEGESVFDVLQREMKENKIHMEFTMTPVYNSHYIEGIQNIYEFDCGELSGWMYKVNDWFPNYGASRYQLQDGDVIEWIYTCDLGRDIGNEWPGSRDGES